MTEVLHDSGCPSRNRIDGWHSDAAKRAADNVNLHLFVDRDGAIRKWVAIALADGSSDKVLYPTKYEAVAHQHNNEDRFVYVCIPPGGMNVCEAESLLRTYRLSRDAGLYKPDKGLPHGGRDLIPRLTQQDHAAAMRSLSAALRRR